MKGLLDVLTFDHTKQSVRKTLLMNKSNIKYSQRWPNEVMIVSVALITEYDTKWG